MNVNIEGRTTPQFEPLKHAFASLWKEIEVGAALCVYWRGEPVVNLWGGYRDRAATSPWQEDTLVNVYSATKGIAAFTFALLVDDGLVRYEDKVAKYWPEFAAAGKGQITIAQLLSHQAGLCGVDQTLQVEDLYDWQKMVGLLENQKPLWPPGEAAGYHAVTWGYFPGELVRRITGLTLGQLFQERVAGPLNLNFYLGLAEEKHAACATLIGPNHARQLETAAPAETLVPTEKPAPAATNPYFNKALLNPAISPFKHACSKEWRLAELAASNGHSDAKSMAKLYALMAAGGQLGNTRLLSQKTLDAACKAEVNSSIDLVTGTVIRRSRGFILSDGSNYGPGVRSFGHAGAGGSMAFADPDANLSFCYVMNQMQPDSQTVARATRLIHNTYACLAD